jgi:hypothetical protein
MINKNMEAYKMTNKNLISQTLARHMMSCISEYELIKSKQSIHFETVKSFCECHKFSHQNFMKIYHRYKQNPVEQSLIPQKRGPRFKIKRFDLQIEEEIVSLRKLCNNRYEIREILKSKYLQFPCATTIYNICKKHGLNKLNHREKQERRKIIMKRIGELVHIDCHQLPKASRLPSLIRPIIFWE